MTVRGCGFQVDAVATARAGGTHLRLTLQDPPRGGGALEVCPTSGACARFWVRAAPVDRLKPLRALLAAKEYDAVLARLKGATDGPSLSLGARAQLRRGRVADGLRRLESAIAAHRRVGRLRAAARDVFAASHTLANKLSSPDEARRWLQGSATWAH